MFLLDEKLLFSSSILWEIIQLRVESSRYGCELNQESLFVSSYLDPDFSAKIKAIYQKFFNLHKISLFSFYRIYDDGTCVLLSSNHESLEYVFKHKIHVTAHIPSDLIKEKFWYIIPPNSIYQNFLFDFKKMFDSKIIFDFIERHENFYEVSFFGSYCETEIATTHFMNYKEEFEKFSRYFKQQCGSLIAYYEKNKIILPSEMQSNIYGLSSTSGHHNENFLLTNISPLYPDGTRITHREAECIYHLSLGHTARETARHLGLTYRTVEYYLANIKDKLRCTKKSEIISLLSSKF